MKNLLVCGTTYLSSVSPMSFSLCALKEAQRAPRLNLSAA